MTMVKRILVGIDTSPQSQLALTKAIKIAVEQNAALDIVTVINTEKFIGVTQGPMGFGATTPQALNELTAGLKANLLRPANKRCPRVSAMCGFTYIQVIRSYC